MSKSIRRQFEDACSKELGHDWTYYFNSREGRWYDTPFLNTLYSFWLRAKRAAPIEGEKDV